MTTRQKRAILYRIFDLTATLTPTATTYLTLLAGLQSLTSLTTTLSPATTSGIITSVAANGHAVQFAEAGQYQTTTDDFSANAAYMRDLYTESKAALVSSGVAAPTDAQIFDEMLFRLTPAFECGPSSFVALRVA